MRISTSKPPVYDEAIKNFDFDPKVTVFAYGNIIFNPAKINIPQDVIVHEEVHGHQQAYDETVAKLWWQRYFQDPEFRISQEIEAYAHQYNFLCKKYKDRNQRTRLLHMIASTLSGPMYGKAINMSKATRRVREYAQSLQDLTAKMVYNKGAGEINPKG